MGEADYPSAWGDPVVRTPPETPVMVGAYGPGYIDVTQEGVYDNTDALDFVEKINLAWTDLITWAGLETLGAEYGLDPNWWPGMGLSSDPMRYAMRDKMGNIIRDPDLLREDWAARGDTFPIINPNTGQPQDVWVRYDTDQGFQQFANMSGITRETMSQQLVDAGLLEEAYGGLSEFTAEGASAFTQALRWANWNGQSLDSILTAGAKIQARRGGGGGGAARRYTIEVPDYDTLLAKSEDLIKGQLGRNPADWEMSLLADEYKRQYGAWSDVQERKALGGNGVYEVPDPELLSRKYMETEYEDEISRLEDVSDLRTNNQLLVAAATKGTRMMGG